MMRLLKNISDRITTRISGSPATSRREFLGALAAALGAAALARSSVSPSRAEAAQKLPPRKKRAVKTPCDLAVARGSSPAAMTRKAIEALGGMGQFVRPGDTVVIKPNIGWNRTPEYAATTNPEIVAALVKLCLAAGAKRVKVFDRTCNEAGMCYANSGISDAAKKAGASVFHVIDSKFLPGMFPAGSAMKSWPVYADAVQCDCLINVPVAKHHSRTGLTLSMKNLMGVCGGNRGMIHINIDEKLADLTGFFNPELTVIDAYRILLAHGPSGGRLRDVKPTKIVIAGTDPVLADAYAATLFGMKPRDVGAVRVGEERGLGSADITRSKIRTVTA
ncbi:MAG: DUF362 domain-containing protein [Spirochaetes bacterium]|nr:DUF362 domain-containing protein [Spirochaetota bacterium]